MYLGKNTSEFDLYFEAGPFETLERNSEINALPVTWFWKVGRNTPNLNVTCVLNVGIFAGWLTELGREKYQL